MEWLSFLGGPAICLGLVAYWGKNVDKKLDANQQFREEVLQRLARIEENQKLEKK